MTVNLQSKTKKLILANRLPSLHTKQARIAPGGTDLHMNSAKLLSAAPFLFMLAACGTASGTTSNNSPTSANTAQAVTQTAVTTDPSAFRVGVNVNTADIWQNSRPFMNLIYGTSFQMQNTNPWGSAEDIPAADLDPNGWVTAVPAGYRVLRGLSVPAAGGTIVCHYQGNGTLSVATGPASNVASSAGTLTFTVPATSPADQNGVTLAYNVDPTNYLRNLDCREANASTTADIAPEFLSAVKGFQLIRFMKWNPAVEANTQVTWANRNKPGDADYLKKDGVPVEVIVDAANAANADMFVSMPWNADNNYYTQFATYVRDHLNAGLKVYVETSNEVWNGGYPVYNQACSEAKTEGLTSADGGTALGCAGERYAEKTQQVMQLWSSVFSGQMSRLVRVFAWQHVQPYWSDKLLAYLNTHQYVDALATAPYFGDEISAAGQTTDTIFATLPNDVTSQINFGVQQKAVAQKYNLQYLTYEGGQSLVFPSNIPLLQQAERDSRMGTVYNQFISGWQSQVGGTLTLFALTGSISQYGGWGLTEYANQPLSGAPKMNAVSAFLGLSTTTATSTGGTTTTTSTGGTTTGVTTTTTSGGSTPVVSSPTQICPDGSIIAATSTCPTSSTTTSGGGKKTGQSKGGGKTATA